MLWATKRAGAPAIVKLLPRVPAQSTAHHKGQGLMFIEAAMSRIKYKKARM